jgi:hypothetical protein
LSSVSATPSTGLRDAEKHEISVSNAIYVTAPDSVKLRSRASDRHPLKAAQNRAKKPRRMTYLNAIKQIMAFNVIRKATGGFRWSSQFMTVSPAAFWRAPGVNLASPGRQPGELIPSGTSTPGFARALSSG